MAAGPLMNLATALGLFAVILIGIGAPVTVPTIASVSACVLPASATVRSCPEDATPTPAAAARLQAGDRVTAFDGQPISSWDQLSTLIHTAAGRTVAMTYERAGQAVTARIPIVVNEIPVFDASNNLVGTEQGGFLGIKAATEYQRESIGGAVGLAGDFIVQSGHAIIAAPSRIPPLFGAIFEGQPAHRTPLWASSVQAGSAARSCRPRHPARTSCCCSCSCSRASTCLFLLNLLPLLPLDGGHILGAIIEWVRRGIARIRGKSELGPFDVARLMPVAYVVVLLFVGLSLLTLVADIINPVKLL